MRYHEDRGSELSEALDNLDIQTFLDMEAIEYKEKTGSSGPQLNLKYCPACGDSKWRTWLNQESGLGNCFHGDCHVKTFNKYSFIREYMGNPPAKDVVTKIKRVSAGMGWRPKKKVIRPTLEVALEAVDLPTRCIPLPDSEGNNLAYLEDRGINSEMAKEFRLHYCVDGHFSYQTAIGEREEQYYGERVVVPIFDMLGRMVTFQGRDVTGKSVRKYLFPPGLPTSGKFLYASHTLKGKKEIAVSEGVFDVYSLLSAFRADPDLRDVGATATFGMHLSDNLSADDQIGCFIKLKSLGLERVTFFWDSEKRAIKKAFEAATRLSRLGLTARVAILPADKDPNESTSEEIVHAYYSAHDVTTPGGKKALLRQLL